MKGASLPIILFHERACQSVSIYMGGESLECFSRASSCNPQCHCPSGCTIRSCVLVRKIILGVIHVATNCANHKDCFMMSQRPKSPWSIVHTFLYVGGKYLTLVPVFINIKTMALYCPAGIACGLVA